MTPFSGVDTTRLLVEGMKVAEFNQRIIANNIANADTPHYNAASVDFQATLHKALEGRDRVSLRRTQAAHLERTRYSPKFESLAFLSKNDYNKVDLDLEMTKLSENTGRYVTYASLLTKRFQQIKSMLNNIR
ncbi:MAG: flagellar basal body rod protein FlgB [Candidatus Hydrogenedentes bacterium]|nr:flagellar basal body rod protein FlgB [Candidatus Hydrogenedentota bacterium]